MGIDKWFNKTVATALMSVSNVEKNALSQTGGEGLGTDINKIQSVNQGKLMQSLLNGEVTQEVMNLRWRMYKTLRASNDYKYSISGYSGQDNDKMAITETIKRNRGAELARVKVDNFDNYKLEMVVNNLPVGLSTKQAMDNTYIKPDLPVLITRREQQKFDIEDYTKTLKIRSINENIKLLEFYVSKYPDEYNRTSRLFISEIKNIMETRRPTAILDIDRVNFTSFKTLGVNDFYEYEYQVRNFDKIIEFNGSYVIKFICDLTINGRDTLEKYRVKELDEKYDRREKRSNILR